LSTTPRGEAPCPAPEQRERPEQIEDGELHEDTRRIKVMISPVTIHLLLHLLLPILLLSTIEVIK
jgi:hypothetical protein